MRILKQFAAVAAVAVVLAFSAVVPQAVAPAQAAGTVGVGDGSGALVPCTCICFTVFGRKICFCDCGPA